MRNITIWLLKKIYNVDIEHLQSQNKRLLNDRDQLSAKSVILEKEKATLTETVNSLSKEKLILQKKSIKLSDEININKTKCLQLQEQVNLLNQKLISTRNNVEILEFQNQNNIITIEKKDHEIKELQERVRLLELESKNNDLEDSNAQIQDQVESLNRQYQDLKRQYDQIHRENIDYKAKISIQNATINILNKDILELHNENSKFKKSVPFKFIPQEGDEEKIPEVTEILDIPISNGIKSEKINFPIGINKEEQNTITVEAGTITEVESTKSIDSSSQTDYTKRTIDTVVDTETGLEIKAKDFFAQPENLIFKIRTELEKAIYLKKSKFICKYCHQNVKISGRRTERGMARFFSHLRDSDECDCKTTTGKARKEINREKYARCNEGERHKYLKSQIAYFLSKTAGVSEVKIENTVIGNHPILKWKRPDVLVRFMGQEIVFELQLSTTFVSVITERDLFYRLNKKFIIWIFNFDEQEKYVNLNNMMAKDIYYNNKLNIFIFDKAAQKESERRGELILKCNWLKTDGTWEYSNDNSSNNLGGKFVTLSELTYDNTYKPYYFDAEQIYFEAHPEFKLKVLDIEEENKKILETLDKLWLQQQEELRTEDKLQALVEAFEIESIIRNTQKYVIGKKEGKCGLITFDGEIKIPFEYESVSSHRGWYEGTKDGLHDLFNKNDYTVINTGIRRMEEFNPIGIKYVKEVNGNLLWGIMTKKGFFLTPPYYSELNTWSPDKIIAVRNGLYCIIDFQGNEILNNYDYISELKSDNTADVIYDGRNGIIDNNCQNIKVEEKKLDNGLIKVCLMDKWGIEKENGITIIPCKYDEIGSYKEEMVGINGISFTIIDEKINSDCPVKVEYLAKNDRKMLIFKVGKREAFMNVRQQQKAFKLGLQPQNMVELYFSFINMERSLLYLSAVPVKGNKQQVEVIDQNIPLGATYVGNVVSKRRNGIIIQTVKGQTIFLHDSTWGKYTVNELERSKSITVEKIGYNQSHNKHIWKITAVLS